MAQNRQGAEAKTEYKVTVQPHGSKGEPEIYLETTDMNAASEEADNLYETGKYRIVEVIQKFHDPKKGRVVDVSLKKLEKKDLGPLIDALLLIGVIAIGAGAFALTYYLTQG